MDIIPNEANIKKEVENEKPKKKKNGAFKYVIYLSFVLIATGLALYLSLRKDFAGTIKAFSNADWKWILIILSVICFSFIVDALVIYIFMRLYTRKYHYLQGLSVSMIGSFYKGITPGASGAQVMEAYTLKKQGTQISNAASILVMYFILYRAALIIFDLITVIFKWSLLKQIGSIPISIGSLKFGIPLAPLTIIGFVFNLSLIGFLVLMSYSHKMHNFIMHYGVGLFAKLHLVKNPDKTRETLRIQVENFKIELRRLLSNFRVSLLILILLFIGLICQFSIPWFAGMALNGYGASSTGGPTFTAFWDACFMSAYHQMITGLIPLPGGAGISEIFFSTLFENYYISPAIVSAAQILWRIATYHIVLVVCGIFSAFYKGSPKEKALEIDRRTFVTMQLETYEERKKSADSSYETKQMSRKELQNRLKQVLMPNNKKEKKQQRDFKLDDEELDDRPTFSIQDTYIPDTNKNKKKSKKRKNNNDDEWRDLGL